MQLTMFEEQDEKSQQSSYGKTYPACLARTTMLSVVFSQALLANQNLLSHQGTNGQTRVLSLAQSEALHGEFSTLNTSDWPNDANVCFLSAVLETTSISDRYYLNSAQCRSIIDRSERYGKQIPTPLREALMAKAQQE